MRSISICAITSNSCLRMSRPKSLPCSSRDLKDRARFLRLTKQTHGLGKTIVALKVGKSERGAVTTMAHTSRMAGSGEVYEAAFRQFGVISTDSVETFLGAAQLAASHKPPRFGKVMILTASGAGASLMADKASEYGLGLGRDFSRDGVSNSAT